jgi:hypothetical protein
LALVRNTAFPGQSDAAQQFGLLFVPRSHHFSIPTAPINPASPLRAVACRLR